MFAQQGLGILVGEPEVLVPYLRDLARRAVAVQGQQGVGPAGEDDAQAFGGVPQYEVQALGDVGCLGRVELVEDEDGGPVGPGQRLRQAYQERAGDPLGAGGPAHFGGQYGPAVVEGLQDVRPEGAGGVARLHGQPCGGAGGRALGDPVGGEDGLAGAGRSVDEGEGPLHPGRQALEQSAPVDEVLRHGRHGEPDREHGVTGRRRDPWNRRYGL
ncbi:hypothetical protein [Streptomyces sp. NPDC059656]|uniref:hypothetical protein n=1 Tax=Streptomyces sp. NPDC059656 TaxID=3346898 RepID=UPI0036BC8DE6